MIFLTPAKRLAKAYIKRWQRWTSNTFRSFTPADLRAVLADMGISEGDSLLVHSSFDAFAGFKGKANDVVQLLQAAVGEQGLLMMPTMTFTGSAVEWALSGAVFDVKRTPSRMGLLSELLRRSPDVVRSVHPTHPVACWGADAQAAAEGHHLSKTPCGRGSPFEALAQRNGKILLLGTDIGVLTFYHYLEEIFERDFPASPFTEEVFSMRSKAANGEMLETRSRLYAPAVSRRRNLHKLVPGLKKRGNWRERRVGGLRIALLDATGVESLVQEMIQNGEYCYD